MGIDLNTIKILHLEADPNGKYIKNFRETGIIGYSEWLQRKIYLINNLKIGVMIHELMHIYIRDNNIDTQAIVESFIRQYGKPVLFDLGSYILCSVAEKDWDEVVCEMVAVYGRRGQFDKITELINLQAVA